jgi:hypothetical protein
MKRLLFRLPVIAFAITALCVVPLSKIDAANADPAFHVLAIVPLPTNAVGCVAVDEVLDKFYTGGGANSGDVVYAFDGKNFEGINVGTGTCANVDLRSDSYWSPTIYSGGVVVRDGRTNGVLATVALSGCPIEASYDSSFDRMWVGAQCGNLNDPVFAIDAKTFSVIAGPIGSGGVMGPMIANAANGRLYLTEANASKRINPRTFALTLNAFGQVMAINAKANLLYARTFSGNNLQIINGAPDPEVILNTTPLPEAPISMGINQELNHLYLGYPTEVEIRDGLAGAQIATFSLSRFGVTTLGNMTVDSLRDRVYVTAFTAAGPELIVLEDLTTARQPRSN